MTTLNRTASNWSAEERAKINQNWEILERGVSQQNNQNNGLKDIAEQAKRDSENALNIANYTQSQLDTIVSNGDSNAEVVQARTEYPNLRNRLDTERNETLGRLNNYSNEINVLKEGKSDKVYVDEQLSLKADQEFVANQLANVAGGSPRGTFNQLSELQLAYPTGTNGIFIVLADGNWYYFNENQNDWVSGGVYQAQGLADNSVTPRATNFLNQSKNLTTNYQIRAIAGAANALFTMPEGDTSVANGRTVIVPIESGETYTVSVYDINESNILAIASDVKIPTGSDYNASNRYTFKTSLYLSLQLNGKTFTFTNTANDRFLFVSASNEGLTPRIQIEKGSSRTEYIEPLSLNQGIKIANNEVNLPTTRNLLTGRKVNGAFTSVSGRCYFYNGNEDIFVVPIEPNKTYTVKVNDVENSNIFLLGTHSKIPSYYDSNGRSYLNNFLLLAGAANPQRQLTFTNTDDRYLFIKAYSGNNVDVRLQVEEGSSATAYIQPFDIVSREVINNEVVLSDEFNKSIYQQDYKQFFPFDNSAMELINGDVQVVTNTDQTFTRYNNTSKRLTFNATSSPRHQLDFTLNQPIDLYNKNFGFWFYIPRETLLDDDQQRAKWNALSFNLYTSSGKTFQVFPQQPKRAWGGWNLITGNPYNNNFSDGSLTFEDLSSVVRIRVQVDRETSTLEPYSIYLDSLVTWKRLNKVVARLEFDDAYKTIYDNAFPEMKKRGIRGCIHVITDRLTDNINNAFATVDELKQMHDVGWDIGSHSKSHPFISTLNTEQIEDELKGSQEILRSYGFKNGTDVYVAPYGDNTLEAVDIAKKYYKVWRNTGYQRADDVITPNPYGLQGLGAGSLGVIGCKAAVDRAIERGGGFLPFVWHSEIGATFDGVRWEISEFVELLEYCISKGVEFTTFTEQYKSY